VIDPATRRLTHVVVQARDNVARLVPLALVAEGDEGRKELALTCTAEELAALEPIREFAYVQVGELPTGDERTDVGVEDMLAMPYYEATELGDYAGETDSGVGITYDRIPKGEVEIRRSSPVSSADGHHLGHVDGLVADGDEVTHVVLERGHLWGKRDVTIPIGAVAKVETDAVTLGLSKDEVGALPSVRVRRLPFT
jgi:hypothetical protein